MSNVQRKQTPQLSELQRERLSHPTNVDILIHLMERPATLVELANELNLVPMEVGYRLRQLTEVGLVNATLREGGSGHSERCYEAAVEDLEYVLPPSNDVNRNANQVRLISMLMRKDLLQHASNPNLPGAKVHMMMIGIRCRPEVFQEFLDRMIRYEQEFNAADDVNESTWHYMTVAMYSKATQ